MRYVERVATVWLFALAAFMNCYVIYLWALYAPWVGIAAVAVEAVVIKDVVKASRAESARLDQKRILASLSKGYDE